MQTAGQERRLSRTPARLSPPRAGCLPPPQRATQASVAPEPAHCPFPGCDTGPRFKPLILGRLCNSSFRLRTDYARFKGIWHSGCTGRAQSAGPTSPARAPAGNSCSWCLATCSELLSQLKFDAISTLLPREAAPGSTSGKNETFPHSACYKLVVWEGLLSLALEQVSCSQLRVHLLSACGTGSGD